MQSKAAKIAYILSLFVFGFGAYWLYTDGVFGQQKKRAEEFYKNYVETEATVVSTENNGRSGKQSATIMTFQYEDQNGVLYTNKNKTTTFFGQKVGDKVTVYYDPEDPDKVTLKK